MNEVDKWLDELEESRDFIETLRAETKRLRERPDEEEDGYVGLVRVRTALSRRCRALRKERLEILRRTDSGKSEVITMRAEIAHVLEESEELLKEDRARHQGNPEGVVLYSGTTQWKITTPSQTLTIVSKRELHS